MEAKAARPKPKRIPYGMMNFVAIREDNCYYVDKTRFIEKIEDANKYFFFIRPRRFGKSLTISMLQHYYDINQQAKFERLYGDLYIGQHPTPEHNKYLVIYLNFAVVHADLGNYHKALDEHCNIAFNDFCDIYEEFLPKGTKEEMNRKQGCIGQLEFLFREASKTGASIYLFIDEYDHFTNHILSDAARLEEYKKETHGTGYLRSFFDTIKAGTYSSIERVFITGVSPVTLDDLTSGFFLLPDLTHYQAGHSYIIELKYLSKSAYTPKVAEQQWQTAVEQIHRYAVAPRVELLRQGTKLHNIIMQFVGWELVRMEEV